MIFCPSCAARIDDPAHTGSKIICPVCGTEFIAPESSDSSQNKSAGETLPSNAEASIVQETSESATAPRRLSTEEILLERLKNDPPQNKPLPWTTLAIVFASILVISFGIYRITSRPNVYAPGGESDSTVMLQHKMFFQHIIDSVRGEMAKNPGNTGLHLSLADALYDAGSWTESMNEFQTYLAAKPHDADARVDYSIAITQANGNFNLALSEIDSALKFKPDHLNALVNGGILAAESINDTNHASSLARSKDYFQRAKAIAEKTNPAMASRIDTLIQEIDQIGARTATGGK